MSDVGFRMLAYMRGELEIDPDRNRRQGRRALGTEEEYYEDDNHEEE